MTQQYGTCPLCGVTPVQGHICNPTKPLYPLEDVVQWIEGTERFATGAVRAKLDDVRYDLIPVGPLRRLAKTYAEGAKKYSDNNWRQGLPYSNVLNHIYNHLALWQDRSDASEDHLAHAAWGLFALMWFEGSGIEGLDDLP